MATAAALFLLSQIVQRRHSSVTGAKSAKGMTAVSVFPYSSKHSERIIVVFGKTKQQSLFYSDSVTQIIQGKQYFTQTDN